MQTDLRVLKEESESFHLFNRNTSGNSRSNGSTTDAIFRFREAMWWVREPRGEEDRNATYRELDMNNKKERRLLRRGCINIGGKHPAQELLRRLMLVEDLLARTLMRDGNVSRISNFILANDEAITFPKRSGEKFWHVHKKIYAQRVAWILRIFQKVEQKMQILASFKLSYFIFCFRLNCHEYSMR